MNIVFIENVLGSGQVITVLEDFGGRTLQRDLRPGENARIVISRFKALVVKQLGAPMPAGVSLEPPALRPRLRLTAPAA